VHWFSDVIIVYYFYIVLWSMIAAAAVTSREYCDWETMNASCARYDEVLIVHSARFGRMKMGRCVTKNYGHIGCGVDVTSNVERACAGRRRCTLSVISLHEERSTCPPDLKAYLETSYECIKGILILCVSYDCLTYQ